eukprot:30998-Pelagococcus_subviridis.AAC.1
MIEMRGARDARQVGRRSARRRERGREGGRIRSLPRRALRRDGEEKATRARGGPTGGGTRRRRRGGPPRRARP